MSGGTPTGVATWLGTAARPRIRRAVRASSPPRGAARSSGLPVQGPYLLQAIVAEVYLQLDPHCQVVGHVLRPPFSTAVLPLLGLGSLLPLFLPPVVEIVELRRHPPRPLLQPPSTLGARALRATRRSAADDRRHLCPAMARTLPRLPVGQQHAVRAGPGAWCTCASRPPGTGRVPAPPQPSPQAVRGSPRMPPPSPVR